MAHGPDRGERSFIPVSIAVLTVSDSRTEETDKSGALLVSRLSDAGLVKHNGAASATADGAEVRTTVAGRVLARRILDRIG